MGLLFNGQTPTGINFNGNPVNELRLNGITVWTSGPDYSRMYLTFEAIKSGTFKFSRSITYSIDGGTTWSTLYANNTLAVSAGNKIMWKATQVPSSSGGIGAFSATGNFNAYGNVMSLLYGDNFIGQTDLTGKYYAFFQLFNNNTKIVDAQNLILPATTLANFCYGAMFRKCTSLTTAPELPATTLVDGCYSGMFIGCTNLNYIKMLATNVSATNCLNNWVYGVSSTGTFVKNSAATWDVTGVNGIPTGWTVESYTE